MSVGKWQTRVICPGCGRNECGDVTFNRIGKDGPCPDCGEPYSWIDGVRWPVKTMRWVQPPWSFFKPSTWGQEGHWEERPV